jgi:NIMA-interacting peptidyl-prolyl cis-trans isomerase 1
MTDDESPLAILKTNPPPDPLPDGWITHKSRSQLGYAYYYNQFTAETRWDLPIVNDLEGLKETIQNLTKQKTETPPAINADDETAPAPDPDAPTSAPPDSTDPATLKNASSRLPSNAPEAKKRARVEDVRKNATGTGTEKKSRKSTPEKVRVLHILKKHNKSRRPASWRQAKITISREEAVEELKEIIEILEESKVDAKELRATFEELAKTESDCTSAKRGGDLGFFGKKKMQPNFEKASFVLGVGELSGIVETSSGVHVLLRLG